MRPLGVSLLSVAAGLIGGLLGSVLFAQHDYRSAPSIVRARAFELTSASGEVISYWGVDEGNDLVLAFGGRPGITPGGARAASENGPYELTHLVNQVAAIGLAGNDRPFLKFNEPDGRSRVNMLLGPFGKPALAMSDDTGPRISLGMEGPDTLGDKEPENYGWTLTFLPEKARIGMFRDKINGSTSVRGVLFVDEKSTKFP
jgi:hypothetical protein